MKVFITGGSGFVGRRLVARLLARGDDVYALARSPRAEAILSDLGAKIVPGDIMDVASMRPTMAGSDLVYHLAGISELGYADPIRMEMVNVAGTRKVLTLAHQLGVPRIIFMSSLAVNGDTRGVLATEGYQPVGPFLTEVDRTKWLAHYQVAKPLIDKGAPIIILMPGVIYGPGDKTVLTQAMARFYFGTMPFIPAPSSTYSYVHVEDVVEAHMLAAERGEIGESYIIAGPAISQGEMFEFWSYLTGKPHPKLRIPAGFMKSLAPLVSMLGKWVAVPPVYSRETLTLSGRNLHWQFREG